MRFEKGDICFYHETDEIIKLEVKEITYWHWGCDVYIMANYDRILTEEQVLSKEEMQLKLKKEYENKLKELEE